MPSIGYRDDYDADAEPIAAAIRARRGGRLLNLDRMLLHSPGIAAGWNALMGQVRASPAISPRHRELAICAVARINGADYEFHHHRGPFLDAGGRQAQLDALDDVAKAAANHIVFDEAERAVLALACESSRHVGIDAETMDAVRLHFPEPAATFELMMVVASYNMVSRLLVGLGIEPEN
ncbi:carboxymuconolactone decarboxylase family protein [Sphingomonas colocasiae]|uniref:Carboxymuconolactone decarboxylase family protein n=1 Tax=Sphingomonas colocasiae TaxID=1848973 RepID=A0ABS7PJW6_9SPHN|nr:carboxymuconolactone decarboxylase family protein [Sphingomonas colocasiae]MBY8821586.1 carboxymuconolactone decarboxylase family protein [Sphingomonas colocasiae]